jgi:hypothetical protein
MSHGTVVPKGSHSSSIPLLSFLPKIFQHLRIRPSKFLFSWLALLSNLRKLVDAVEVGEGLGDTLAHGDLTGADPDTRVVEPG